MGKSYDLEFFFAPTGAAVGAMQCATCGKAIDNQSEDFRAYKKTKNGDWGFVTHHRTCSSDQSEWEQLEKAAADAARRRSELVADLAAAFIRYRVSVEQIADLATDLGEEIAAVVRRADLRKAA